MFLDKTVERNGNLVEFAFDAHRQGLILPDSYIVDVDTFTSNASMILGAAREHGFSLFYMLKQLGRNPYLATILDDMGYDGAVVVDFREAAVMMDAGVRIGNVGHLVQIPDSMIGDVVSYGVDDITLYSLEKAARIDQEARRAGIVQNVLIRVTGEGDMIYSGQTAGFDIARLGDVVKALEGMGNLRIAGVTSFPCYLYDSVAGDIMPTGNLKTVLEAAAMLESMGHGDLMVNTPSTTCTRTIAMMGELGGNCGEPGHGLTGTTPLHAVSDQAERPCVVYLSEVSHRFGGLTYAYGGGHYRRSHVTSALVGSSLESAVKAHVVPPSDESIDYHFGLETDAEVGQGVVMAFRYQIFVTRSDVVLVKGLSCGRPEIVGVYDALGRRRV